MSEATIKHAMRKKMLRRQLRLIYVYAKAQGISETTILAAADVKAVMADIRHYQARNMRNHEIYESAPAPQRTSGRKCRPNPRYK